MQYFLYETQINNYIFCFIYHKIRIYDETFKLFWIRVAVQFAGLHLTSQKFPEDELQEF